MAIRDKVFISYSRQDTQYRDEVRQALESIPKVGKVVWFDEQDLSIGEPFHPGIQQALAESKVAILLLSTAFLRSDYIKEHELPYCLQHAETGALKIGQLYVNTIPKTAFNIDLNLGQHSRNITLTDYLAPQRPNSPLNTLDQGARDQIYAKLADWVASQLTPAEYQPQPDMGQRFELSLGLEPRHDHWQHHFSLPHAPHLASPDLDCIDPQQLLNAAGYEIDGDDLYHLLLGRDPHQSGELLGAAFGAGAQADPTFRPLRIRLRTSDARVQALPWTTLSYQGERLMKHGWSVELHPTDGTAAYPPHVCYIPSQVILVTDGARLQSPQASAHFRDLDHFFQRRWPTSPAPAQVTTETALRDALDQGTPRVLYYYGEVSATGLTLDDSASELSWSELATLLQQTRSISIVFLNLLGEPDPDVISQSQALLSGTQAVLVQYNPLLHAVEAARAAQSWLHRVFDASEQLDPVVALHRASCGLATAWTRYSNWHVEALPHSGILDLADLLLDRRSQRAEIHTAKEDFYDFAARRVYHAVALGTPGCQVTKFPEMAALHLRQRKREPEIYIDRRIPLNLRLRTVQDIDNHVRQQFGVKPFQPVLDAMLQQPDHGGPEFWFLVLGWIMPQPLSENDVEAGANLMNATVEWCRTRLFQELPEHRRDANIRLISIVAIEAETPEIATTIDQRVAELSMHLQEHPDCEVGDLQRLGGVSLRDLGNYFGDPQICSCPNRHRAQFPGLIMGSRQELTFELALATIQRGEPDNWHNLIAELQALSDAGDWPPADNDPTFWESRDGH